MNLRNIQREADFAAFDLYAIKKQYKLEHFAYPNDCRYITRVELENCSIDIYLVKLEDTIVVILINRSNWKNNITFKWRNSVEAFMDFKNRYMIYNRFGWIEDLNLIIDILEEAQISKDYDLR